MKFYHKDNAVPACPIQMFQSLKIYSFLKVHKQKKICQIKNQKLQILNIFI